MQNASIQATGEAMPAVTRRSFLGTTAGVGAAAIASGGIAVAAQAIPDDKSSAINALLADYLAETRRFQAVYSDWLRARDSLPAWASAGPSEMYSDGSKGGYHNGWPELAVLPTPDPERTAAKYLIRPSLHDLWKEARSTIYDGPFVVRNNDGTMTMLNPPPVIGEKRRAARLRGYQKVREAIARRRQQREEWIRAGLPRLDAEMDASCDRSKEIEMRICDLASGVSPAEIAAVSLFEFMHDTEDFPLSLLKRMAPHLSGLLRVVVLDMIVVGAEGVSQSLLYLGQASTEERA
ncbi:hypothetical protein [Aureimonas psammosilenae]|uniref:hypothetical protein n=1 Tax=Aureimonas psammosilenae TaxID=2495496 RepID=UPI0012609747|nr:hypothetical protein [Aureimonas psammosilenae]